MIIKDQSSAGWNYYEASTDDGASSSRMSHLQQEPDHDHDPQRPPSPPHQIHTIHAPPSNSPARRRLGLTAFASTLFVVAMSAGLATFFLLFIILSQVPNVSDPAAFVVRERTVSSSTLESSSLSALAVSTTISHFLSITTPIVLSLLAYRIAHLWIQAQSSPSADEEGNASRLPTPLHYGVLVRILNSSTILNLGPLAAYFLPRFRRHSSTENTTAISTPRLLREAFATAFFIYALSHAIGLADIWLHSVSSVGIANSVTRPDKLPNFSMVFNQTICDPSSGLQCMNDAALSGSNDIIRNGALVAANSTNPTKISVITLADVNDTAILTPSDFVREWNFSASTYGARAQCYPISDLCAETGCSPDYASGPVVETPDMYLEKLRFPKTSAKVGVRGPGFGDYRDLSRIMAYVGNVTVGSSTGVPASVITEVPPNPGPVLIKLRWTDPAGSVSYARESNNGIIKVNNEPGRAGDEEFQGRAISVMYAQCQLEFVKVRYGYNQKQQFVAYNIRGMTGDAAPMAAILWSPLIWQRLTDQLVNNIHQACLTESTPQTILATLEQELSRLAIGGAAGLFMRTAQTVSDASKITQVLVGRYPRTPVYVFAGLLYGYAALAIILFLSTAACTSDVIAFRSSEDFNKERMDSTETKPPQTYTALQLAQRRLVDPATLIAEQFVWALHTSPTQASAMASRVRTADMFGVNQPSKSSTPAERLFVGLGGPYSDTGDPRFGVWRRPKRQIDAESDRATYMRGPSSISTNVEVMEGTTLVGSMLHNEQNGMPPAYATLSRGARSRSDGSEFIPEYATRHGSGLVDTRTRVEGRRVDLNVGARRPLPEKEWSGLARAPSNASSEGSEASTSTVRMFRRGTGV